VDYIKYTIDNKPYLIIIGCDSDTNNDKVLDQKDLLHIFHYDCVGKKLIKITKQAELILESSRLSNSDVIVFDVGIDKNGDNQYTKEQEPVIYKKLNLNTLKYDKLIKEEVHDYLQKILDGQI